MIDDVRQPASPLLFIKYSEAEGKVNAEVKGTISKKIILSVEK